VKRNRLATGGAKEVLGKVGKKRTVFECARLRALSVPGPGPAQLKALLQRPLLAGAPGRAVLKRPEPGAVKKRILEEDML